jgi:hypothetical protein
MRVDSSGQAVDIEHGLFSPLLGARRGSGANFLARTGDQ